jgi:type VI secretion system secreted protein VgrG
MAFLNEATRLLSAATPLGADVLLLTRFSGQEAMSRLFTYHLDMISEDQNISPKDIVGRAVSWAVQPQVAEPRYFHGVVSRFAAAGHHLQNLRTYRLEVVPTLWLLTRTANCRIFQQKTTPDIIKTVFGDYGLTDFEMKLQRSYPTWEYCVQYRETAFNFVSRLMEHEGIFYYFRHEKGKHTLVLADHKGAYKDCPENQVQYTAGSLVPSHINGWEHQYEFRPGKWAQTDYNFQTPSANLLTTTKTVIAQPGMDKFEIFDYPGEYPDKGAGQDDTKVRMEEEEAAYEVATGSGGCCTFSPGGKFTLTNAHEVSAESGKPYVLTSVQHHARDTSYDNNDQPAEYGNSFTCIPAAVVFRPARLTRKPVVQGPQTAVVVGPAGEEIFTDKYGRVKVQFFWDREGKKDDKSSCWIRVSQNWAGKNWGLIANPRIGQEVVVDFLEGDPDRPLITGRVYNAEQMPPYDLPANQTQTGIKTRSSKGGSPANFNEIRFEDKKGGEQLFIHAEKNQDIEVEKDETHWVGQDRKKTIDRDETTLVKGNRTETVNKDETITIHQNRTEVVDKEEKITIHGGRTEEVDHEEKITIHGGRTEEVDHEEKITIHGGRTEQVDHEEKITIGGGRTESVKNDENITIGGGRTESVKNDENITIGGGRTESVKLDESVTVTQNRTHSVNQNDTLNVGKVLTITAGESISLTTGKASIFMKNDGTITISGKDITVDAKGEKVVKAGKNITMKGKNILQN